MQNQTPTCRDWIEPGKTYRRNGRIRLQGLIIKRGKHKNCKIIDDDLRVRGSQYVIIEVENTTASILLKEALKLV